MFFITPAISQCQDKISVNLRRVEAADRVAHEVRIFAVARGIAVRSRDAVALSAHRAKSKGA